MNDAKMKGNLVRCLPSTEVINQAVSATMNLALEVMKAQQEINQPITRINLSDPPDAQTFTAWNLVLTTKPIPGPHHR